MRTIYLDHNATTPPHPEVVSALAQCYLDLTGNPASQHQFGRSTKKALERARESIAQILGAENQQVIFTSGGTEANNLALLGLAGEPPGRIIISAIEHPSVVGPAKELQRRGFELLQAPVSSEGVVDIDHLRGLLAKPTGLAEIKLVSIMLGNNETGVLQDIAKIADLCRQAGVRLHTDAVQAVGKISVDFQQLGVDALSLTAHKLHGPMGIGALIIGKDTPISPILFGGHQQTGLRPGVEPVALAVGFHKALELWRQEADQRALRMTQLRDRLEEAILAQHPQALINGKNAARLPHTTNISFPGFDRQALLIALDMAGVACSTGSACASGSSEPSPILLAMGLPKEVVEGSLRISLGAFTTLREIDAAASRILQVIKSLRSKKAAEKTAFPSRQMGPGTL